MRQYFLFSLLLIVIFFLGLNVFTNPYLFCLSALILTSAYSPVINWKTRLITIAYAFGTSTLAIEPVKDALGEHAIFQQIIAWLLLGMINAAPWLIIYGKGNMRIFTSLLACLVAILPPVGTIAIPSPFMTAGYLFPGTGILGLVLIAAIIIIPVQLTKIYQAIFILITLTIITATNLSYKAPSPPQNWQALNTSFKDFYDDPIAERNKRASFIRDKITDQLIKGAKVIITPETILGFDSPGLTPQLDLLTARARRHDAILLIGLVTQKNNEPENSLLILGGDLHSYEARQPVPLVMWNLRPTTGFKAHWFRSGTRTIKGKNAALLICWEELVPWPMLVSAISRPEIILSASNHGWANNKSRIWGFQSLNANALARLYNLPIIRAVNLPH